MQKEWGLQTLSPGLHSCLPRWCKHSIRNTNVLKCGVFILWISIIIMATFFVITHNRLTSHKHIKRTAVHLLRSSWNPPSHDPPTISGLKSRVSPPSVSLLTDSTTNQTHPAPGGEIKADGKECGVHAQKALTTPVDCNGERPIAAIGVKRNALIFFP